MSLYSTATLEYNSCMADTAVCHTKSMGEIAYEECQDLKVKVEAIENMFRGKCMFSDTPSKTIKKKQIIIEETKESKMKYFKIESYRVYNDKVVNVRFADGTEEKAVCNEDDVFDLSRAIEVCVLKYIFGANTYKKILKESMRQIKDIDKAIADEKAELEAIERKKAKAARHKAKRLARKRTARVAEMKEAYLNAMFEYDNIVAEEIKNKLVSSKTSNH